MNLTPTPAIQILQSHRQWVLRDAKKQPYNPLTGYGAKAGVATTWGGYEDAYAALQHHPDKYTGLGYQFSKEQGITGIDLDHCIDENGTIDTWAMEVLTLLASYAEFSVSGNGIHIFVYASLPEASKHKFPLKGERHPKAAIEIYDHARYFAMTFNHVPGTPTTLESRRAQLDELYSRYSKPAKQPQPEYKPAPLLLNLSDSDLLEKARTASNGTAFFALWNGDWSNYGSQSEADSALCTMLAFWTGKDAHRIDSLFRQSGLYRQDKWERNARSGETYGEGTIKRAMDLCREVYAPHLAHGAHLEKHISRTLQRIKENQKQQDKKRQTPYQLAPRPIELKKILEHLNMNEYGDALLFKEAFDGQVCYDHTSKEWYLWGGHHWIPDRTGQVHLLVTGVLGTVYLKAAADLYTQQAEIEKQVTVMMAEGILKAYTEGDGQLSKLQDKYKESDKLRIVLNKRANDLRTAKRNKNVQVFIQSEMGITSDMWDTNPWLLAVPNGVIDLHTGQCRDGEPDDYIRTVCPTEWTGLDTPCPRFERFLQEIFEEKGEHRDSLIDFLHRYFGYGITGLVNVAMFLILYGEEGRNGKDTLLGILKEVLGPISGAISNDVFVSNDKNRTGGAATPHLCDLQGKRLVWGSETRQGDRLNIAQIKQITGGGEISARQLYGKQYQFNPTHKLLLMTNYKPHADANDKAFWSRVCLIEFGLRFVAEPQTPNERKADTHLKERLQQEASGILAWLVRGCLNWQKKGISVPPLVKMATKKYRDEEDRILQFLRDCCATHQEATAMGRDIYEAYKNWCYANNIKPTNGKQFGEYIGKRYEGKHTKKGELYRGIAVIDEQTPDEWIQHNENGVMDSISPVTTHHTVTGASLEGRLGDGVTVRTHDFLSSNSTPHSREDLGVLTVTPSLSCDDKRTAEAASGRVMGKNGSLTFENTPGDDSTQRTPLEEATLLLAQIKNHFQQLGKKPDEESVIWVDMGCGYRNDMTSPNKYIRRIEDCIKSEDAQLLKGAINTMRKKLRMEEYIW